VAIALRDTNSLFWPPFLSPRGIFSFPSQNKKRSFVGDTDKQKQVSGGDKGGSLSWEDGNLARRATMDKNAINYC